MKVAFCGKEMIIEYDHHANQSEKTCYLLIMAEFAILRKQLVLWMEFQPVIDSTEIIKDKEKRTMRELTKYIMQFLNTLQLSTIISLN